MKKISPIRLLLCAMAAPLFFSCSASREFTSFSAGSGAYHTTPPKQSGAAYEEKADNVVAVPGAPAGGQNQLMSADDPIVNHEADETSLEQLPDVRLGTMQSRLKQANQEAAQANTASAIPAKKPGLAQKLALKKAQKMLAKASAENQKLNATNPNGLKAPMLDYNLKLALVFLIASLIAGIFSWLVGTILLIVALVFFILWIMSL